MFSISTLVTRNLVDVFGENDAMRRRAAIDEIFTEDCVFYDPKEGVYRGRDEIDRIAGAIRATHPDFQYQPIAEPEEVGNAGRLQWVSGRPGEAPVYAGTDFIIVRDGRIAVPSTSFSTSCPESNPLLYLPDFFLGPDMPSTPASLKSRGLFRCPRYQWKFNQASKE
jgi:hypothetical protein